MSETSTQTAPPTLDPDTDYPLSVHRPDLLRTPTGRPLTDLTMEQVMSGEVIAADLRITPETLRMQAEIAVGVGRPQLGDNLRRAAELTVVSDERVLEMYNALRPHASTKAELLALADELEGVGAVENAALVREAADVYERRDMLAAED